MPAQLIIDSCFRSLDEAVQGLDFPREIFETLVLLDVRYVSFDGRVHQGQVVLHRDLKDDVQEIFASLLEIRFPIMSVIPMVAFGWDDDASMNANNSSSFNYRVIAGTDRLSEHAEGIALDINPLQNPFVGKDGTRSPCGAVYDPSVPGTITKNGPVVALFRARGWEWGGGWFKMYGIRDYQHFEKALL